MSDINRPDPTYTVEVKLVNGDGYRMARQQWTTQRDLRHAIQNAQWANLVFENGMSATINTSHIVSFTIQEEEEE